MSIFDTIGDWMKGVDLDADKTVQTREVHVVNGRTVKDQSVNVSVKNGDVIITGDVRSLTINGRRVRFLEPK